MSDMNNGNNWNNTDHSSEEGFMDKAEGFFDKASDFITENGEKVEGKVKDFAREHDLETKAGNAADVISHGVKSAFRMIKDAFN